MDEKNEKRTPTQVITNGNFTDFMHEGWFQNSIISSYQIELDKFAFFKGETHTYLNIPNFIGIKKGEITLVWGQYNCQETTKAVLAQGDTEDFELGFLIAYYKRVHEDWPIETLRRKISEIFDVHKDEPHNMKDYFLGIFYDNCLLDRANANRFLRYVNNRKDQPTIVIPRNFVYKEETAK